MRRIVILTAAVLLSGCAVGASGGEQETVARTGSTLTPPPSTTERTTTAPTTTANPYNNRGNRVKQFGEEGGILDANGNDVVTFVVDSIAPIQCNTGYAEAPENGVFVGVQMRVSTGPNLGDLGGYFGVNPYDWSFVGADNITVTTIANTSAALCLEESQVLDSGPYNPGSQYVGMVVLDVPANSGTLIYDPSFMDHGWEWNF